MRHTRTTCLILALTLFGCSGSDSTAAKVGQDAGQPSQDAGTSDDGLTVNDQGDEADDGAMNDQGNGEADDGNNSQVLEPGTHDLSIESGEFERTFTVHIPQGYDHQTASPLVFVFHGGGGDAEGMQGLGFNALADRDEVIVVYPNGIEKNWADGRGTTDAALAGADDVTFVRDMLDELSSRQNIDAEAVFATGISNGGILSHRLACDLADRIAAIGPVVGSLASDYRPTCNPSEEIGVISIRGTEDPFINFEGGDSTHKTFEMLGDGGPIESAEDARLFWASQNGCDDAVVEALAPIDTDDPTRVTQITHEGCDGGVRVVYYAVEGMGHTWPPNEGPAPRISGSSSSQLNATELVWEFFFSAP